MKLRGLYAITDSQLLAGKFLAYVEAALDGGVTLLQYRDKSSDEARRLREAEKLHELCRPAAGLYHSNHVQKLFIGIKTPWLGLPDRGERSDLSRLLPEQLQRPLKGCIPVSQVASEARDDL